MEKARGLGMHLEYMMKHKEVYFQIVSHGTQENCSSSLNREFSHFKIVSDEHCTYTGDPNIIETRFLWDSLVMQSSFRQS